MFTSEKTKMLCFTSSLFEMNLYIYFLEELYSHIGENMENRQHPQLQRQKTNVWYLLELFCPNLLFDFLFLPFFFYIHDFLFSFL